MRLKIMLGGKCVSCGATSNLEFDHIDKDTKSFTIWENLDKPWVELLEEIRKCQLFCRSCHNRKTHGVDHGGGLTGKGSCKCEPCKLRKREYMRVYMQSRRRH